MTLKERLLEYVAACFTGLWVQTFEDSEALREIADLCRERRWPLATWDVDRGLEVAGQPADVAHAAGAGTEPVSAIKALASLASPDGSAILVLKNLHRQMGSLEVVQAIAHQIEAGKQSRAFLIVLSPIVQIPVELQKLFVVVEHDLPGRDQLLGIAQGLATEAGDLPTGRDLDMVLEAAAGLTRFEAEGAFSLSLVRKGRIDAEAVWQLKGQMLKKSGLLELHRGVERFDDLGGLDAIKQFCLRALRRESGRPAAVKPRGVMLLGLPGSGKSAFCKALGNETGRPTIFFDVGAMMGSLVGESEANIRRALQLADAMQPCILLIDEVEKALAGVRSSGQTDSGVSARMFGTFLTWLADHETDVFCVCTANDVSQLPPEFTRAERFDGVFFLDLPAAKEKKRIWSIYLSKFGIEVDQPKPSDADWTPAEIRSCCRLAALLGVSLVEAAQQIVPVAVTASEAVERLRVWASGRCLSADQSGVYRRAGSQASSSSRKLARDPSPN